MRSSREEDGPIVRTRRRRLGLAARSLLASVAVLTGGEGIAHATDVSFSVAPSVDIPLGKPQSAFFGTGEGVQLRGDVDVTPFLDVDVSMIYSTFPGEDGGDRRSFTGIGGGLRGRVPRAPARKWTAWGAADLLFVKTGDVSRAGFSIGAGAAYSLLDSRTLWLGPFVRYDEVFETSAPGIDSTNAKTFNLGVALEFDATRYLRDSDHDDVPNNEDRCPNVAGPVENHGCPTLDSDQDGVVDADDKCPDVPGPAANDGCPYPDTDKDGVLDRDDLCPDVPGTRDAKGCPDRDNDTVPDREDKCPDVAGEPTLQGCPRYKQISVTKERIVLEQKIFFAFDKDEILPKSFALLEEVVKALSDRPGLKIRIEGHTDDRGNAQHNLDLSTARAISVAAYLATHGIDAARLVTKGYGSQLPLESNETVDGRERNRRVEFIVIDDGDAPVKKP